MPKLLIPYYAIATGAFTADTAEAGAAAIVATADLNCALDCDPHNYFWWSNCDAEGDTQGQYVNFTYTGLADMAAEIAAKFGASARWGMYVKIDTNAYIGSSISDENSIAVGDFTANMDSVYGDAVYNGTYSTFFLPPSIFAKQIKDHDGDIVMYLSSGIGTGNEHVMTLNTFDSDMSGMFKTYHIMDGLLVDLPFTPDSHEWGEIYEGGDLSTGPYGKVLHSGYRNVHMDRGKRRFTILFPEISSTRYNPSSRYAERATHTNNGINTLLESFKAGKGVIPMLYMHDETDTGTWSVCRFVSLNTSEPAAGYWNAEATFEEY
jgi:hypothetical protein